MDTYSLFQSMPNLGTDLQDFLSDARRGANASKTRLNYLIVTHGKVTYVLAGNLAHKSPHSSLNDKAMSRACSSDI